MSYPIDLKEKATQLRKKGYSIKEISKKFKIAQSTSSLWLSNIELPFQAQERLRKKKILGQYKAVLVKRKKRELDRNKLLKEVALMLSKLKESRELYKLYCSLLYWCEGNKDGAFVRFTSSDPTLIKLFISLLRKGFKVDEAKFRGLIHLHSYHDETKQKLFWSAITEIPLYQFNRSYRKPNTGKRKQENYPGCIAISYYDSKVAKELKAIYNIFVQRGVR